MAGLLEILWLTSGAVNSTTTSTRPAISLLLDSSCKITHACCYSDLQLTTLFDEHYTCKIPIKLPDYSRIMLYRFADRLLRKFYQHIRRFSRYCTDSHKYQKATWKTVKRKSVRLQKYHFSSSFFLVKTTMFNNNISKTIQVLTVILSQKRSLSQHRAVWPLGVFIATNSPWLIKLFSALPDCWQNRELTRQCTAGMVIVVAKAYALGKGAAFSCLHYSIANLGWLCSCLSTVVSFHVKENQEISCTKRCTESGWPFIRF